MMINGSKPASGYVGKWLLVRSYPDFGFGYCTGIRGGKCVISFVDVPRVLEHEVVVATEDLVESPIPIGTRVWVRGDPYGWHAGVIRSLTTADRYVLRWLEFPDQSCSTRTNSRCVGRTRWRILLSRLRTV